MLAISPCGLTLTRVCQESSNSWPKKMGCSIEHPLKLRKNYRFFAAFFFAPLTAFFAIVFSSGLATQPQTNHSAVTTGGLSHPPSYQM